MFLFGWSLVLLGAYIGWNILLQHRRKEIFNWKKWLFPFKALLPALPYLIMALHFYSQFNEKNKYGFIPFDQLAESLSMVSCIINYSSGAEEMYTRLIFLFLAFASVPMFFKRIKTAISSGKNETGKKGLVINDLFGGMAILLLAMYFIMPDTNQWSGYFSMRIQLIFYLFWVIYLAKTTTYRWLGSAAVLISMFVSSQLNRSYKNTISTNSKTVKEINGFAKYIREGSIVQPIIFHQPDAWLNKHIASYLGIDREMVILDNYEADMYYFPLTWKALRPKMADYSIRLREGCSAELYKESHSGIDPDYIFLDGIPPPADSCREVQFVNLEEVRYRTIRRTSTRALFERIN